MAEPTARPGRNGSSPSRPADPDRPMSWMERRRARPSRPAWPTLRRALKLLWPHRLIVAIYLVTVLLTSVVGLGPPLLIRRLIDHAIPRGNHAELNLLIVEMVALVTAGALVGVLRSYLSNRAGQVVVYDLRVFLFEQLSGL